MATLQRRGYGPLLPELAMPLAVYFRDMLEPEVVDEDFNGALAVLNQTAGRGLAFTVMDGQDGNHVMIHVAAITKIKELDD